MFHGHLGGGAMQLTRDDRENAFELGVDNFRQEPDAETCQDNEEEENDEEEWAGGEQKCDDEEEEEDEMTAEEEQFCMARLQAQLGLFKIAELAREQRALVRILTRQGAQSSRSLPPPLPNRAYKKNKDDAKLPTNPASLSVDATQRRSAAPSPSPSPQKKRKHSISPASQDAEAAPPKPRRISKKERQARDAAAKIPSEVKQTIHNLNVMGRPVESVLDILVKAALSHFEKSEVPEGVVEELKCCVRGWKATNRAHLNQVVLILERYGVIGVGSVKIPTGDLETPVADPAEPDAAADMLAGVE